MSDDGSDHETSARTGTAGLLGNADDSENDEDFVPKEGDGEDDEAGMKSADEESEEDDDEQGRPAKRRKRNQFLADEAEVGGEDEESDMEEAEEGYEELRKRHFADNKPLAPRSKTVFDNDNVEAIVAELDKRHQDYAVMDDEPEIIADLRAVRDITQQTRLPTVKDPGLWLVKCTPGSEREICLAMMNKCAHFRKTKQPFLIKSVICRDNLKGYVYIEAAKEDHIKTLIRGMRSLMWYNLKLVPLKEMPDVLTVQKKDVLLKEGAWVRVKRGVYKGDIAQVVTADESGNSCIVRIIPRLDLERKLEPEVPAPGNKRKRQAARPPAKFFNFDEVSAVVGAQNIDQRHDHDRLYYVMDGQRFENGYLVKSMQLRGLQTTGVTPTLDELHRFRNAGAGDDDDDGGLKKQAVYAAPRKYLFVKGDEVIVTSGELMNLTGTVLNVDGDDVTMQPHHEQLTDALMFPAKLLRKQFKLGSHVKVINGVYTGETGHIVRVEDSTVVLFSDLSTKEVKVFIHDIQEATEVASGLDSIGEYELYDLVEIDARTVGCIVKVERDSFKVLDNSGVVRTIKVTEIGPKKTRRGVGLDQGYNQVNAGDIVRVVQGPNRGQQGTVKHVYRAFVFLFNREVLENAGVFVARSQSCSLLGSSATPQQEASGRGADGRRAPPPQSYSKARKREDNLLHKTVRLVKGTYKGYAGVVLGATDTMVRVELHSKNKTVSVKKDDIVELDAGGNTISTEGHAPPVPRSNPASYLQHSPYSPAGYTPGGGRTPLPAGSQTPMHDSDPTRTPMHYPMTPSYNMTPRREAPRTPMHGDAPRTPMHDGSRTPHYEAPGTPAHPGYDNNWNDYQSPAASYASPASPFFATSGGTTPALGTPGGAYTTPSTYSTPGAYGTPGGYGTPAAYSTPNPSGYTPGYAPYEAPAETYTPGEAYTPGTPGMTGGATPGTPGFAAPGSQPEPMQLAEPWLRPRVVVRIRDASFRGGKFLDSVGYIEEARDDEVSVNLPSFKEVITVKYSSVTPEQPGMRDRVVFVQGPFEGEQGSLMSVDGTDVVVRKDGESADAELVQMADVAKLWG